MGKSYNPSNLESIRIVKCLKQLRLECVGAQVGRCQILLKLERVRLEMRPILKVTDPLQSNKFLTLSYSDTFLSGSGRFLLTLSKLDGF